VSSKHPSFGFPLFHPALLADPLASSPSHPLVSQVLPTRPSSLAAKSVPLLIIDTVKPAEEPISPGGSGSGRKTLVVRVYEPHGCRGFARLAWDREVLPVQQVVACNLLEDDEEPGTQQQEEGGDWHTFQYSPFKVLSFKLYLA
jgi:hypothetical protein